MMISLCSVFFYLSFFNNLRQAFSLVFLGLFVLYFIEKKYIYAFLCLLLGFFVHKTLFLFLFFIFIFFILNHIYQKNAPSILSFKDHVIILFFSLSYFFCNLFIFKRSTKRNSIF